MWIERTSRALLLDAVAARPAVVLTGARQTGKTSLLRRTFPAFHYVSLDLPGEAELAENDPLAFLTRHPPPLIVDEVQYAPGLFRHLKSAVDARRSLTGQFILTGSQKFHLMHSVSDSLAGRVQILELEPLSLREIRDALGPMELDDLILRGGYPELYRDRELDRTGFYHSYIATYLERDVRTLLNVSSLRDFERFLRACALRSGQLLNKAELARDVGINPMTANQWLSVMETSGQAALVEPWFSNKTKSIVKSPKLYLTDTGLLTILLNIGNPDELRRSPMFGAIWETFVFAELRKREAARQHRWSIHFFNDRRREVDFLIDRGGRFELYEAKSTEVVSPADTASLDHVREILGRRNVLQRSIVCRSPGSYPLSNGAMVGTVHDL